MTTLPCDQRCEICGRSTPYSLCDICWESTLRETADRQAKAIARQQGDRPEGDRGEWTWNDG